MKKFLALLLCIALIASMSLVASGEKEEASASDSKVLEVWSFTRELNTAALAFEKLNPGVTINYTEIPMNGGEYQTKVLAAAQTKDVPDVVALEASFVREWIESDFLMDISDLEPKAKELGVYQNVLDVGTYDGEIRGYSYQSTPGAVFYRRSLAKEYFGTDDPIEIQAMMSDMEGFREMAKIIKEKSNGNTYIVPSTGDFTNAYYANRELPWVVDGTLTLDPMVYELMEVAKEFRQKGYEAQATQWSEGWFAGMNDKLKDAAGNAKQVFCYFLPTWGLSYTLAPNAPDTTGDWACVNGPLPYQWGGTWIGAMKDSDNVDLAKAFVEFCTLNEEHLTNWATGVYTNDYLKAIDPEIGDLAQAAGDFTCSTVVNEKIEPLFDDSAITGFLAGQNSYGGFMKAAPTISARLMQGTDDAIQRCYNDPLEGYVSGETTKEECLDAFKLLLGSELPDIRVK